MQPKYVGMCLAVAVATLTASGAAADDEREALIVVGQSARVERDQDVETAIVVGGDLVVEGRVREVAAAIGGDLRLAPGAMVGGPVASVGGELLIDQAAKVGGPKVQVAGGDFSSVVQELSEAEAARAAPFWMGSVMRVVQTVALFVMAIFLVLWAPRQVTTVCEALVRQPARDTLVGLGVVVGFVPFCALLAVSIIGLPLIPVTVLLLLATFIMGLTAVAIVLGRKLHLISDPENQFGAMALGMLLLAIAAAIPFLGGLLMFIASVYAAGAVVSTRFGTRTTSPPSGGATGATPAPTDVPLPAER